MSALQRAVLNTGQTTYAQIQAELYEQGVDVSETTIRKAMRAVVDTSQAMRRSAWKFSAVTEVEARLRPGFSV